MKQTAIITILSILFVFVPKSNAQMVGTPYIPYMRAEIPETCSDITTKGTDFWVSFGKNAVYNTSDITNNILFELRIAADVATNVTLTFTATGRSTTYSLNANSMRKIDLSNVQSLGDMRSSVYLDKTSAGSSNKTLHITSTQPISVYAFNTGHATTDATIVLPVSNWGSEYYRFSALPYPATLPEEHYDYEMIIAKEATTVTLPSGKINLSAGDVYYNPMTSDNTGRHVTSNKPVAYFSHATLAQVPSGRGFGDIIFEQLMPVDRWGTQFLIPNASQNGNTMNNLVRIVASVNGTKVNFSGATRNAGVNISSGGTLNAGQWVELLISNTNGACYINADKPVGVCAYLVGSGASGANTRYGDPSIAWIPPVNQPVQHITILPFMFPLDGNNLHTNFDESNCLHYAMIITKTSTKTQTKINNTSVTSGWTDNSASGYSYYIRQFNNTSEINSVFSIENPSGVIVLCCGIARVESYYYNAGSGACIINQ